MKILLWAFVFLILLGGIYWYVDKSPTTSTMNDNEIIQQTSPVGVMPVSHATMVLDWGGILVYNDPIGDAAAFASFGPAHIVLVSDVHGDHLNAETIAAVLNDMTTLIVPQAVVDQLPESLAARATKLANGEATIVEGISITAVPMYNVPENDDAFHTKGRGNGYILEKDGYRVYIAGDTGPIEEMKALQNIDMAFVPMNLPYTMDVATAAEAVLAFAPKRVYPYHYRGQDGLSDVEQFKTLVNAGNPDINVVLLQWYPEAN